jgi:alkanesulfonate monooxygenase SsuD/methylene tetrahydromethanopterin reductase-like flavin-dependent oxidoreductase (luciferase family)
LAPEALRRAANRAPLNSSARQNRIAPVSSASVTPNHRTRRRPALGVVIPARQCVTALPEAARRVEALGFDELWVVEDCFAFGGLAAAGAALASTSRLRVGIGLLPVGVRNAAIAAMEIATLAQLHPGRLDVAFGHGVEGWMRQIGARPADRIVALREVVEAIRALLAGETVDRQGRYVRLAEVRLEQPPDVMPDLLIGTTGERGIEVARHAHTGVLLPEGTGPAALTAVKRRLGRAAPIVTYAWLSLDDDANAARERLQPAIDGWRAMGLYPTLYARGEPAAVAGTPRDCAQAIIELGSAGATSVALLPVGPEPDVQLERVAAEAIRGPGEA